jgi:hypothetical protein
VSKHDRVSTRSHRGCDTARRGSSQMTPV